MSQSGEQKDAAAVDADERSVLDAAKALETGTGLQPGSAQWTKHDEMTMGAAVLLWSALVLAMMAFLITREKADPGAMLKLFGTILVVVMSVFLVVVGYTQDQIAPVVGLLGTIAGYLLGKPTKAPESARTRAGS